MHNIPDIEASTEFSVIFRVLGGMFWAVLEPIFAMYLIPPPINPNTQISGWQAPQTAKMIDLLDDGWQPPERFRNPTEQTVLHYWVELIGQHHPELTHWAIKQQIPLVLAKFGFLELMRILTWISLPQSKYYQYPCTLKVELIEKAIEEMRSDTRRVYTGFIGPTNLKDLLKGPHLE